ncbi:tyrosine-type recombinase/integrase [Bacillaceae bacterium IKA-2]|nr:tyrosine-type recombinase/integrase [Bacillaceae bacterium IKA-2]
MAERLGKRVKTERKLVGKSHSLDYLFEKFIIAKTAEGRTVKTIKSYHENYSYFIEYLDSKGIEKIFNKMTSEIMRNYIVFMLKEKVRFDGHAFKNDKEKTIGLSPVTVNTRLKTLRTFFKFLCDESIVDSNPLQLVKKVEENDEAIIVLTLDELQRLLNAPNLRRYTDFRDYVLMNVLLDSFLRINEALSLKASDIDAESGVITIRSETSKSRRTRIIPIQKSTVKLLTELIDENEEFETDYIFLANYGEPMEANHFRKRLKQFVVKAGITKRVHPHLFRHTGATIFLEAGGDIRHLQMILGHKDIRMVLRYTHLSNKALKNQHDRYSPLNILKGKLSKERKILL